MIDQNSMAQAHFDDGHDEDPLAELARVVAGTDHQSLRPPSNAARQPVARSQLAKPAAAAPLPAFDLEELLMQELGSAAADSGAPAEPVAKAGLVEAAAKLSLEDQLMAALEIFDQAQTAEDAAPGKENVAAAAPANWQDDAGGGQQDENDFSGDGGFEAEPDGRHHEEAALAEPVQHAIDSIDSLDFSAAFEAEIRQMETSGQAVPVAAPVHVARSLATPVVPKRESVTERELEDHFAAAFANELDIGFSGVNDEARQLQYDNDAYQPQDEWQAQGGEPAERSDAGLLEPARLMKQSSSDPVLGSSDGDFSEDWDQYDALPQPLNAQPSVGARLQRKSNRGFAFAAIALVFAVLLGGSAVGYGYFANGPATGEPVIVKADKGPVKVKPENPGGAEIANQDQVAYDKVAGGSNETDAQEELVSASETPVEIAAVEEATAANQPLPGPEAKVEERLAPGDAGNTASIPALAPRRVKTVAIKPDGTVIPAAAEVPSLEAGVAAQPDANAFLPEQDSARDAAAAALQPSDTDAQTAGVEKPATRSLAGEQPPTESEAAPQALVQAPALSEPVDPPAPKAIKASANAPVANSGGWAVQLASQRSAEDAEATFRNLKRKFPSVLDGKELALQRADVEGKGVFYRVRVQAASKEEAVALCERLKAAGGSCFIGR